MKKSVLSAMIGLLMLSVNVLAVGTGTLNRASGWYAAGSNFTVTATAASNSVFSSWLGATNGCAISGNQITIVADGSRAVTSLFSTAKFPLTIASAYGTATPAVGTSTNDYGTVLTPNVTTPVTAGTTQYICSGWAMTGNGPASGTSNNFTMTQTNNAALTWQWTTNYMLTVGTSNCSVNVANGFYGTNVTITATPSNGYSFAGWTGATNGCTIAGNQITAVMTQPRAITAVAAINTYTLNVSTPYGTAVPAGLTTNNWNSLITATVTNPVVTLGTTQYVCYGWTGTGSATNGTGTNTSFNITTNSTIGWLWTTNYWIDLSVTGN